MAGPWPDFLGARPDRDRSTPPRGFDRSRESGLAYRVEQIHAVDGIAHGDSHRPRPALASHVFGAYQRCNFFRFHILPNSLRDAIYGSEENILPPSLHATLPASHFLPKLGRPEILVRPFFWAALRINRFDAKLRKSDEAATILRAAWRGKKTVRGGGH